MQTSNQKPIMDHIACWEDTLRVSEHMDPPPPSIKVAYCFNSAIKFFDMDAIECCLKYAPNALILNLADDLVPGGCVAEGSRAQEEALFRCTNYHMTLTDDFYPIKDDEVVYSPGVSVIKTSDWTRIETPPKVSFVACPGLKYPRTIGGRLCETDVSILKMKIRLIIRTALKFGHDTIIFGALGCGAWNNPSDHVAEIFKEVLDQYNGMVPNYYFAILTTLGDDGITRNTIDVFRNIFLY